MTPREIPSDSIAIIDSSVLFAMGGPSNDKYQALERFVRRKNISVKIPTRSPKNWVRVQPNTSINVTDSVQHRMQGGLIEAKLISQTQMCLQLSTRHGLAWRNFQRLMSLRMILKKRIRSSRGLAYQCAMENQDVSVLVSDRLAQQAMTDVLSATTVREYLFVVEGRELLTNLICE